MTALYLLFIPVIRGISNLNNVQSAECFAQSVALIGVLIIVPITRRELETSIREIIYTKTWSYMRSVVIRLLCSFGILTCLILAFALIMQAKNCVFPLGEFVFATILYAGFMGTIGLVFSQLGNNVIIGYLTALGYWSFCQLQIIHENDVVYLFPVINGEVQIQKLIILLFLIIILIGSLLFLIGRSNRSI